ncbi:TRAP transporter large permease subunit [Pseudomonas stutzeri]|uniref:TRAP transporter large permease n=1 Tax=Stutzerimonas stutzeri TaxID=316 RepID=UPI00210B5D76|nr:TRAP transporter large permease subunit [Stutzerimonas stutzeri]MCQ4286432.1 TRAP transporter large permease subunit [Stutzerimonas stutzeri]
MGSPEFAAIIIAVLIMSILLGVPVVISLGLTSFFGLAYLMGTFDIASSLLASSAFGAIRAYEFATIPLFVLLGEILARSGAATDLFQLINQSFKRLPGRLALATVGGNAAFGAVTGVSIASAAAFSRIAYPEMARAKYDKGIALGCIAGSASLGMLLPPSVLLIIWGVMAEQSIGKLFIAGVVPGVLLASLFFLFLLVFALLRPHLFGADHEHDAVVEKADARAKIGATGVILMIMMIFGGIWFGLFTPTEAAGIGVLGAVVVGLAKGMGWRDFSASILNTGRISAPLLFLLITAQMYSRLLSMGGIGDMIGDLFLGVGGLYLTLAIMVGIWLVLGMFLDSTSIILLTVPIFAPIATALGFEPLAFAILGILAIEAGLLTPPLGLCVYTVKGCIADPDATLGLIFRGSIPYWIILLLVVLLVALFPGIASWLPTKMM